MRPLQQETIDGTTSSSFFRKGRKYNTFVFHLESFISKFFNTTFMSSDDGSFVFLSSTKLPIQMFTVIDNALLKCDLTVLRDKHTPKPLFRLALDRLSEVMATAICGNFELDSFTIETPLEPTQGYRFKEKFLLAPVLRAGLGLQDGFLKFLPHATVSHIGVSRDHATHQPHYYYSNIPSNIAELHALVLDPMLATGGSAAMAVNLLKEKGAKKLTLVSVVAAPEGVKFFTDAHPDVNIFTAALDRELNAKKYILPGLGDAGDRLFGT
jgi:uracil phosphoribosyltransferase